MDLKAVHYAVMARQLLHYHAALAQTSEKRQAILLGIRAAMMAENLAYIVSREQGRGNVLIFAHNSHLKCGKVQWQWGNETVSWCPVGSHLHERFGLRYAVIGSAVGESPANGIGQPEVGTLEARFTSAPGPVRFIPTHQKPLPRRNLRRWTPSTPPMRLLQPPILLSISFNGRSEGTRQNRS